jgi:DNA-binding CsgD family transcriptional regulator
MKIDEHIVCKLIHRVNNANTVIDLLTVITDFFYFTGAVHFNYTNLNIKQNNITQTFLKHHNYTQEWVKSYTLNSYSTIDPAVIYGKVYQKTAEWNYACNAITKYFILNKEQTQLLKDMMFDVAKHNLSNGIGIPISHNTLNQYGFYIVYPTSFHIPSHTILEAICYIFNNAFIAKSNENFTPDNIKFPFSPQERELIKLIYDGKERQDIAEIMKISINTVDTMTKRLFIKMRVNSKMQLITKIIAKGWLGMLL